MGNVKDFLKKVLPPPVATFDRGIAKITRQGAKLAEQNAFLQLSLRDLTDQGVELARRFEDLAARTSRDSALLYERQEALMEAARENGEQLKALAAQSHHQSETLSALLSEAESGLHLLQDVQVLSASVNRTANEAVWAQVFTSSIEHSRWLQDRAFSPGRWAVGYPYLYVLYRVLEESRPRRILELGLGQSTRMTAQYAAFHPDVEHSVVEHDQDWIDFFTHGFGLPPNTSVVHLDRTMGRYKDADPVRVFAGFREAFSDARYDLILIDAPLGGDMRHYARVDILGLLPDCLTDDFVIILDDAERVGETNTGAEIGRVLNEHSIPFTEGRYSGVKDLHLWCSRRHSFLSSL